MSSVSFVGSAADILPPSRPAPGAPHASANAGAAPSATRSPGALGLSNPRLHIDLALNRLVLEFYNADGSLANSIPSQRQLAAYRLASLSGSTRTTGNTISDNG